MSGAAGRAWGGGIGAWQRDACVGRQDYCVAAVQLGTSEDGCGAARQAESTIESHRTKICPGTVRVDNGIACIQASFN